MDATQQRNELLAIIPAGYVDADIANVPEAVLEIFRKDLKTGVLLWGEPGVGKTYAMSAMAKQSWLDGFSVQRVHFEMLCLKLRDTFKPNCQATELGVINPLLSCDRLFVEDLGVAVSVGGRESDFSLRTVYTLLEHRLENHRPTYVTSNKGITELGKSFDMRIADRLRTFDIIRMSGQSKRSRDNPG